MASIGRKIGLGIGVGILTAGLVGPLGPVGIGLGMGLIIGSQKRSISKQLKTKKRMTAEENNQLVSVILPVIVSNGK